jgi:hypothetical protein
MSRTTYWVLALAVVLAIAALAAIGQRVAPPQQAANSAESRQACKLDAPDELKAAGTHWCAIGLFSRVTVSTKDDNVIAVLQFSQNGAQAWQMQNAGLIGEFRTNTDRMAAAAKGMNVAVDVHDAADKRIAACARLSTDAAAQCEEK